MPDSLSRTLTEAAEQPRFSPLLAQRRADLLSEGAPVDGVKVQQLNAQLVEHDAACAALRAEVQADLEAKWAAEDACTNPPSESCSDAGCPPPRIG